ncbi:MAG: transposase, partial [Candidatus Zixiibacteriota bacterium]
MGLRGRQNLKEQRVFFVTTTIKEHENLFQDDSVKAIMREILFESVRRHKAELYGYVIMPNHIHLLLRLEKGGPGLSKFM